jgi:hypothetical protein
MEDDDDEDQGPLWWQTRVSHPVFYARIEATRQRVEGEDRARDERNRIWRQRHDEFKDVPNGRNWAIWRRYKAGGVSLEKVGEEFGVTRERIRQAVAKLDRKMRWVLNPGVNKQWDNVSDEIREGTLGVEFVFRNELTFNGWDGDQKGWDRLEPDVHRTSAYRNPMAGWKPEWGPQDTSPAKPIPAYTYYKTIIEKEQADD